MITKHGDFIEIKPTQYQQAFATGEILSLDVNDRKIVSVHTHEPRGTKYKVLLDGLKKNLGYYPACQVLEITHSPREKVSHSTKTLVNEIIYFNIMDMNMDYEKIKNYIYYGTEFK